MQPHLDTTYLQHSPSAPQWQRVGVKHHHGIVIPLFSIHSSKSLGIGEYLDLLPLITWCKSVGMNIIQLLPINDTGRSSSPYSAISAFALHPVYLSLRALPFVHDHPDLAERLKVLPHISNPSRVNPGLVLEHKESFLKHYFDQVGAKILTSNYFQEFKRKSPWLQSFALFKTLKEKFQWTSWETWPEEYRNPTHETIDKALAEHRHEVNYHEVIQYLCAHQLAEVHTKATHDGVFILGDIPFLVDRDSADVWFDRELFRLDFAAGAPPDQLNKEGQKWGFPLYNWGLIAERGYNWWKERLGQAQKYYHLYRIDHVVGLFRIYAFPLNPESKHGAFHPADPALWIDHGQKILMEFLKDSTMLPIAEDLGTVPPEVRLCLTALGISGLKVLRWERDWEGTKEFLPLQDFGPVSVTTVSTHDCDPLRLWWKTNVEEATEFAEARGWTYHPQLSHDHLKDILWDSHHSNSLFHINLLQEYLSLVPELSWPNSEWDRINLPGTISELNWTNRVKPTVEELTGNHTLQHLIHELIT